MKFVTTSRMTVLLLIVVAACIFLPSFYWKANAPERPRTAVFYSPILKDFLLVKADVKETRYTDPSGRTYTRDENEALLPLMNFRQLMSTGKLPDSLDGVKLEPRIINLNNVTMRFQPAAILFRSLDLYPLMESKSGRVRLELPQDVFRITDRMEFINAAENTVNEEKSELFTSALTREGFAFPPKRIFGNPTTRKPFDEGYLIVDGEGKVFHVKMVKGAPFCRNIGIPADMDVVYIAVTENELRECYGMIITRSSEMYLISYDQYRLIRVPVSGYDWTKHTLQLRGDLLSRLVVIQRKDGYSAIAMDRQYQIIKTTEESWPGIDESAAGIVASWLFPFVVETELGTVPGYGFFLTHNGWKAWVHSAVALGLALLFFRRIGVSPRRAVPYAVLVFLTGVFGLLAVLIVRDFGKERKLT